MKRIFALFLAVSLICGFFRGFAQVAAGEETLNIDDVNFKVVDGVLTKYKGNGGSVTIPEGVTALEKDLFLSFYNNADNFSKRKITTLNLPSTLREIRSQALSNITVKNLVIPGAIPKIAIGQRAFAIPRESEGVDRKSNLKEVRIDAKEVILGSECFRVHDDNLSNSALERVIFTSEKITQSDDISAIKHLFRNCASLKEAVFSGNGSYVIGDYCFYGCGLLERVIFSEGMTGITGSNIFVKCAELKELILPESCRALGNEFLSTYSSENLRHAIKDVAVLSEELEVLGNESFRIDKNQTGLNIYAYPGTASWNKLKEARYIKDDPAYPAKHTLKTLTRDAKVTVQNASGTGLVYGDKLPLTTVRWDACKWSGSDGDNPEAGILKAGYPSFETTALDAWRTAISGDAAVESINPDRFMLNGEDHDFADAGGVPIEDGDKAHFYKAVEDADGGRPDENTGLDGIIIFPDNAELAHDGRTYIGKSFSEEISLSVRTINPGASVTLTKGRGASAEEAHPDDTAYPFRTFSAIPLIPGVNRFTVTVVSVNGNRAEKHDAAIILESGGYVTPEIEPSQDGGTVIGGAAFEDMKEKINGNTPRLDDVMLVSADTIKADLPGNPVPGSAAVALDNLIESTDPEAAEGLKKMRDNNAVDVDGGGNIIGNRETLWKQMSDPERAAIPFDNIVPQKAVSADVPQNYTAVISIGGAFKNAAFKNAKAKEISVLKLDNDNKVFRFKRAESLPLIKHGEFIITDENGIKVPGGAVLGGDELLYAAIRDNSELDSVSDGKGKIIDPIQPVRIHGENSPTDAAPGGGCDAGIGVAALVTVLALHARGKRD
jgi:hypothetical protein